MGTNRPPRTVGPFFLPEQKQPEYCPGCFTLFMLVPAASMLMLTVSASIGLLFIAVLAGAALFHWAGNDPIIGKLLGGLLCMVGHMFPFQFEFKGGKGVLAGGTMACFMGWKVAVAVWGIFFLMVILTR